MNKYKSIFILLIILFITILATRCKKDEETEAQRKERLTLTFNEEINADSLRSVVEWLQGMGTRFALADNHRDVAVKIKNRFIRLGYTDSRLDSFMINKTYRNINYQQWQYNVTARLEGSVYPDSICIIGAHYDNILKTGDPFSVVPGANDNASGVAAAIEIARVMQKNNYTPANTIEFVAFGSEELGLYGSYAFSGNARLNSRNIILMLNNDMIAYQPGTNQTTWTVNIIDYDNSHNLREEAEVMCNRFTVLNYYNDNTFNRQSDSYPFFTNGYKALFFFSGLTDPYYHTIEDKAEMYNFDYCREIVKVNCAILVDVN